MSEVEVDIFDLPADPEEAFSIYEDYLRRRYLNEAPDRSDYLFEREYALHLAAFCDVYGFDLGADVEALVDASNDELRRALDSIEQKARLLAIKFKLRNNLKIKSRDAAIYVLSAAQKKRLHNIIDEARSIIADADLSDQKRDALANRLNAFALEIDRDRTRGEILMSAYVAAKREVSELGDLAAKFDKMIDVLSKGKELIDALPPPKVPKLLTGPKETNGSNSDEASDGVEEEIPF